jgi:adenosylcobinamide-GDP ribazoletransferase
MFLTRLPCPRWCDHSPPFLVRSLQHFPLVGAAIGLWAAVFFNAAVVLLPRAVASGASTLATVWLCGCFHEDGLADSFDAFGECTGLLPVACHATHTHTHTLRCH